jgi:hypothetical protein
MTIQRPNCMKTLLQVSLASVTVAGDTAGLREHLALPGCSI